MWQILLLTFLLPGCAFTIKMPSFDSQQTAMEKQVIGDYEEIDHSVLLQANLRSAQQVAQQTPSSAVDYAKKNQVFNQDDLDELKDKQLLGETYLGFIEAVPQERSRIAAPLQLDKKLQEILLYEENRDRQVLFQNIKAESQDKNATLEQISKTYASLKLSEAKKGHWIKISASEWQRKL